MDIKEIEYVPAEASLPTDHGEFKIRIFNDASKDFHAFHLYRLHGNLP